MRDDSVLAKKGRVVIHTLNARSNQSYSMLTTLKNQANPLSFDYNKFQTCFGCTMCKRAGHFVDNDWYVDHLANLDPLCEFLYLLMSYTRMPSTSLPNLVAQTTLSRQKPLPLATTSTHFIVGHSWYTSLILSCHICKLVRELWDT